MRIVQWFDVTSRVRAMRAGRRVFTCRV